MFINNNQASFHLWWKENLVKHPETITHIILETNSSFHVKKSTKEKVQYPFFRSCWPVLKKISILQEDWALVYDFSKFGDFPDFS